MFMKANNLIDLDQLSHAEVQELITLAGEIRKNPACIWTPATAKLWRRFFTSLHKDADVFSGGNAPLGGEGDWV